MLKYSNEAFPTTEQLRSPKPIELAGGIDGYLMALNFTGGLASTQFR